MEKLKPQKNMTDKKPLSAAVRKRIERQKKRDAGYKKIELWVKPEYVDKIKYFSECLHKSQLEENVNPEKTIKSKGGKAVIKIIPMFSSPGVIREYRLQPMVQEDFEGEWLWSSVDFIGLFGNKHSERHRELPEAEKVANKLVERIESLWAN